MEQTILAPLHAAAMSKSDSNASASASVSLASFHGGNSALILGPRGSGKSLVVDSVLSALKAKHKGQFITVRLSGLAQTDDKLALHEIAAQIERGRREIEAGESLEEGTKMYRRQSANRTLAKLVTMLSGRSGLEEANGKEQDEEGDDDDDDDGAAVVSVIIVLDEFERFATMQNRQTLLYNLLDAAQSPRYSATSSNKSRAPSMCVVGISSRMTAPEMLEKRVRSRFSHRVIVIPHASDIDKFWQICEAAATLESGASASVSVDAARAWNAQVAELRQEPPIERLVKRVFATTKDPRQVHVQLAMGVQEVGRLPLSAERVTRIDLGAVEGAGAMERVSGTYRNLSILVFVFNLLETDTLNYIGLSELALMLLVCAARSEIKYGRAEAAVATDYDSALRSVPSRPQGSVASGSVNFAIAYGEYLLKAGETRLAEAAAGAVVAMPFRVWSREQAAAAWECLEKAGLIQGAGGSGGLCAVEVSLRELATVARGAVVRQWCRAL